MFPTDPYRHDSPKCCVLFSAGPPAGCGQVVYPVAASRREHDLFRCPETRKERSKKVSSSATGPKFEDKRCPRQRTRRRNDVLIGGHSALAFAIRQISALRQPPLATLIAPGVAYKPKNLAYLAIG